jgi:hypothetical protein
VNQSRTEGLETGFGSLDDDLHPLRGVVNLSTQAVFMGQSVDKGAKSHALHSAGDHKTQAFETPDTPRLGGLRPWTGVAAVLRGDLLCKEKGVVPIGHDHEIIHCPQKATG